MEIPLARKKQLSSSAVVELGHDGRDRYPWGTSYRDFISLFCKDRAYYCRPPILQYHGGVMVWQLGNANFIERVLSLKYAKCISFFVAMI